MGNLQYRSTVWIGQHICADSACSKNQTEIWYRLYGTKKEIKVKKPQCQAGDKVRLNKKFRPFKKKLFARVDRRSVFSETNLYLKTGGYL